MESRDRKRPSIQLRLASNNAEREAIYRFRYRVYVEEMKRPQRYADQERKRIVEPLDRTGRILGAFLEDETVVGTCRLNYTSDSEFEYAELYGMNGFDSLFPGKVSFATKLMVSNELRRGPLFLRITQEMFRIALFEGARVMLVDCNDPVRPLFERLGFIAYKRAEHSEYGRVTVMALFFEDLGHLERVRSPWTPILKTHLETQPV